MNRREQKRAKLAEQIRAQREWMRSCGGTLSGYVANYGEIGDARHYGAGGRAIYAADREVLAQLEAQFAKLPA